MARFQFFFLVLSLPYYLYGQSKTDQFMEMAVSEIKNEDFGKAFVHLDSAAALSPDNAEIDVLRAEIYTTENQIRKAISSYDQAINKDPNNTKAFFERSKLRYLVKDHRNYSLQDIDNAINLEPENTEFYVQKAFYLSNTNNPQTGTPDYSDAINVLETAIAIAPDSGRFYDLRGQYNFELGFKLAAITDFTKAIQLDPENPVFYNDRGLIKLTIEDYEGAIEDFTQAIEYDPLNEEYMQKRGHGKFNLGNYSGAISDFTLAINTIYRKLSLIQGQISPSHKLNKNLQQNYIFRGSALLQERSVYEACSDFRSARQLGSRKGANYFRRYCN